MTYRLKVILPMRVQRLQLQALPRQLQAQQQQLPVHQRQQQAQQQQLQAHQRQLQAQVKQPLLLQVAHVDFKKIQMTPLALMTRLTQVEMTTLLVMTTMEVLIIITIKQPQTTIPRIITTKSMATVTMTMLLKKH